MKNKNYAININNIYLGKVARINRIFVDNKAINKYEVYRSIIFTPNKNNQSQDLLYDTPNYPIINISTNEAMKLNDNTLVVIEAFSLKKLLKYYNYNDILTINDIKKIYKFLQLLNIIEKKKIRSFKLKKEEVKMIKKR